VESTNDLKPTISKLFKYITSSPVFYDKKGKY